MNQSNTGKSITRAYISRGKILVLVVIVFIVSVISAYTVINIQDLLTNDIQANDGSAGQQQASVQLTLLPQGQITENDVGNSYRKISEVILNG